MAPKTSPVLRPSIFRYNKLHPKDNGVAERNIKNTIHPGLFSDRAKPNQNSTLTGGSNASALVVFSAGINGTTKVPATFPKAYPRV